jgi:hypothetical protein
MYIVPGVPESPLHITQLVELSKIYGFDASVGVVLVTITGIPLDNDEIRTEPLVFVLDIDPFGFNNQYPDALSIV